MTTSSEMFLFVSHVSEDLAAAMQIVEELERRGVRCWIAPRDVRPGEPFDDEIANAIEDSRAMLLIFSERCNASEYIRREVTVAGESHKVVIPFRIENAEPKRGLRVRLSDLHWLDGFASREQAIDELVRTFPAANEKAAAEQGRRERGPPVIAKYGADTRGKRADEKPGKGRSEALSVWPLPRIAIVAASLIGLTVLGVIGVWVVRSPVPTAVAPAQGPVAPTQITVTALSLERERALKPKDTFKECSNCPEMVVVPAGTFTMGSPASEPKRSSEEGPQHTVSLPGTSRSDGSS
jgi:hypothetical protein